jgi:shikimate dehydrogenase
MKISGKTVSFAVLGHPVAHSLSPAMHQASFESLGLDAVYMAYDVMPDNLMTALEGMRALGFRGANLTVPLKEVAFAHLTDLDASARLVGAVNTVHFHEGKMTGYNTDGDGFIAAAQEAFGPSVRDERVFVLGTGGAGRAVALVCAREGAAEIILTDVDEARAAKVAEEVKQHFPTIAVAVTSGCDAMRDADLVVQSTPIGMKPGDPVLAGPASFRGGQKVYDLIYITPETPFLSAAREAGAHIANGLGMLLHQGARAFTIWTGQTADTRAMRATLEKAVYGS